MFTSRIMTLALLCSVAVAVAAHATGHALPQLTGPLPPLDKIVDGHTYSTSLQPAVDYTPAIKIGEVQGTAGASAMFLQVTRYTYQYGTVQYEVALSTVPHTQVRSKSNTVALRLDTRRYLLKAMSDEIVLDTGFFLTAPRQIFHLLLDPAGNIVSATGQHFNGMGMKRLELTGAFHAKVERFDTLHTAR